MKRNRNEMGYRIRHWMLRYGWKEIGKIVFEIITALAFFALLFFFPALLH